MTLPSESELFYDEVELKHIPEGKDYDFIRDAAVQLYYSGDFGDWIANMMERYGWSRSRAERFLGMHEQRIARELRRLEAGAF
jgi:glycerol dehydrogenase-like iron-containing ADH family enzyme